MPWCPAIIKTPIIPTPDQLGAMYPLVRMAEVSGIVDAILSVRPASRRAKPFPLTAARALQVKHHRVLGSLTLKYRRHHRPIDPKPHMLHLHIACKKSARVRGPDLTYKGTEKDKMINARALGAVIVLSAAVATPAFAKEHGGFRRAYNQLSVPSYVIPDPQAERNIGNFGFSGRDPSRPGGWDPSLNPSGS